MTHKNPLDEASRAVAIANGRLESALWLARLSPTAENKREAKAAKETHKLATMRLEAMLVGAAYALSQVAIAPYKATIVTADVELYGRLAGIEVAA